MLELLQDWQNAISDFCYLISRAICHQYHKHIKDFSGPLLQDEISRQLKVLTLIIAANFKTLRPCSGQAEQEPDKRHGKPDEVAQHIDVPKQEAIVGS